MNKTIAITGATGFVGGAMVAHFLKRGWRVLAFGRRAGIPHSGNVRYMQWDITQGPIAIDEPVHAVIHAAAYVSDWGTYNDFYTANVTGTKNVLDSFAEVEHFIHISSSSVYNSMQPKHHIDETHPYAPHYLNHYGTTKMQAEQVVVASGRCNCAILRPHAIYGPGDTTLLPRLLKARRGRFLFGVGNGKNRMSLTYIGNLCHAAELVTQQRLDCEIFNIVDADPVTLDTILHSLVAELGIEAQIIYIPTSIALGLAQVSDRLYRLLRLSGQPTLTPYRVYNLISECTLDIGKARDRLGYNPPYDFQTGVAAVKHWLEEDGGWALIKHA